MISAAVVQLARDTVAREDSEVAAARALGTDVRTLRRWLGETAQRTGTAERRARDEAGEARFCPGCDRALVRRENETPYNFAERITCGTRDCVAAYRNRLANEKRIGRSGPTDRPTEPAKGDEMPSWVRFDKDEVREKPDVRPLYAVGARPASRVERGEAMT